MDTTRRFLFDSALAQAVHIVVRPSPVAISELAHAATASLVLPLAGVFARHDGPRKQSVATPSHAVFFSGGDAYRISLPGNRGDESLELRFSDEMLARTVPHALAGRRFDPAAFAPRALLTPQVMLARSLFWRELAAGATDPLAVEESCMDLLGSCLDLAHQGPGRWSRAQSPRNATRRRQVERVMEAVSLDPGHKWSLDALADVAHASPWHLARVFREDTGASMHQYVTQARLARALDAVLDGDDDLTTIALDNGFASHSHFTARFRTLFRVTPAQLRRQATGRAARDLRKRAAA